MTLTHNQLIEAAKAAIELTYSDASVGVRELALTSVKDSEARFEGTAHRRSSGKTLWTAPVYVVVDVKNGDRLDIDMGEIVEA